jgi:hypothetical protein
MNTRKRIEKLEAIHPAQDERIIIGNPEIGSEMISITVGSGKSEIKKFTGYRPGDTIVHTTPPNGELTAEEQPE